jgi:hypothetical protein
MRANGALSHLPWIALGILGAHALADVATSAGSR